MFNTVIGLFSCFTKRLIAKNNRGVIKDPKLTMLNLFLSHTSIELSYKEKAAMSFMPKIMLRKGCNAIQSNYLKGFLFAPTLAV